MSAEIEKKLDQYLKIVGQNVPNEVREEFLEVCNHFGLNPFLKEAYLVKYNSFNKTTKQYEPKYNIIVSFLIYLRLAEDNPMYDGYNSTWDAENNCKVEVYRKDRQHPISFTAHFNEFKQNTLIWNEKPKLMIEKCAMANAFRRAFPSAFQGLGYCQEEMPPEVKDAECEEIKDNAPTPLEAKTSAPPVIQQPVVQNIVKQVSTPKVQKTLTLEEEKAALLAAYNESWDKFTSQWVLTRNKTALISYKEELKNQFKEEENKHVTALENAKSMAELEAAWYEVPKNMQSVLSVMTKDLKSKFE